MKYLDENGLLYVIQKVKGWLGGKVDKIDGKGLSTNDLTNDLKTKYDLTATKVDELTETGGAPNVIEIVKVNGTPLTPDGNKTVDVTVPTKTSDLTNDSNYQTAEQVATKGQELINSVIGMGYQTAEQVNSAISSAVGNIQGIEYSIVTSLPSTGEAGIIYLVSNGGDNPNVYDEYIWLNSKFEKIGTTAVDLSNCLQKNDVVAITNAEIDTIVA